MQLTHDLFAIAIVLVLTVDNKLSVGWMSCNIDSLVQFPSGFHRSAHCLSSTVRIKLIYDRLTMNGLSSVDESHQQ